MKATRAATPTTDDVLSDASKIAAKAFFNTPCYTEVFREESSRLDHLDELFKRNFALVQSKAPESVHCYYNEEGTELVSTFMLVPSHVQFSLWEKISQGLLTLLFIYGYSVFMRLINAGDFSDFEQAKFLAGRPCLHLQRMVVNPAYQGHGLGSQLLGEALKEADRQGIPVVCDTQDARNVIFYSRLGFQVIKEIEFQPKDGNQDFAYKSWLLFREPVSQ